MAVHRLKRNDTRPVIKAQLLNPDGTANDLAGATKVWLHVKITGAAAAFSREMTVVDSDNGIVSYTVVSGDWSSTPALKVGEHECEYEVLGSSDARGTFPNNENDSLIITQDIADGAP